MIVALDTETYYDDEVSIKTLGTWHYLRHPNADLYLLSVAADNGLRYVGHPKDFDWSQIIGPDVTWLSHNVSFDSMVIERLQEIGHAPDSIEIAEWVCTADLAAYLGHPRSLKESAASLLGVSISKDVRDNMKGKRWDDMDLFFQDDVRKYALDDAVHCLNLFLQHGDKFVAHEREISAMTRTMCSRGVPLDVDALNKAITKLQTAIWEAKLSIPWADKEAILSPIAVRAECEKAGIWAPSSFAKGDDEAERWEDEFSHLHPWIKAVRNYRRGNKHLSTLETMRQRLRADGTMPYGLKFFGAHTGRDSGDGSWNAQNLPKGAVFDVDIRSMIKAPEGYTLAIVDLSQIEPRVLHWLAGDTKMLNFIRESSDLYYAQAKAWGLYTGNEEDFAGSPLRHTMKQLALGLSYGMGAKKFASVANVDPQEAERLTRLYRSKNPKVTQLWRDLEDVLRVTAASSNDKDAEIDLPSGRKMTYRNVSVSNGGLTAEIPRQGKFMRLGFWGGVVCENLVQATARDVFMDCCLRIEAAGIPILMRIHDEVVCQVPEESAQERLNQIIDIMSTAPEWATGLPLAAKGGLSKIYKK
jgi:DNA polymerase